MIPLTDKFPSEKFTWAFENTFNYKKVTYFKSIGNINILTCKMIFLKLASYLYIFAKMSNFFFWGGGLVDGGPLVYITILGSDNEIFFVSIWMVEKKTMTGITKHLSLKMHFAKASYQSVTVGWTASGNNLVLGFHQAMLSSHLVNKCIILVSSRKTVFIIWKLY